MILPFRSFSGEPFLYDSFTNRILAVSEALHGALTRASGRVSAIVDPVVRMACLQAGLQDREPGIDSPEELRQEMERSGLGLSKLVLGLTHQCNLRCRYCIYGGSVPGERTHEQVAMSLETARRVVEHLRSRGQVPRNVLFYGGEPLLNWDVLRFFVETFDVPGAAELVGMSTNGLLLEDPERLAFLVAHRVLLNVSLDGPGQDGMRVTASGEGTLARLLNVLGRIRQAHPDYYADSVGFVATVTPFTRLLETADFFNRDELFAGKVIVSSWVLDPAGALGTKEELEREKARQAAEREALRRRYPQSYGKGLPFDDGLYLEKMVAIDRRPLPAPPTIPLNACCYPGLNELFVDASGRVTACERTEHFPLGEVGEELCRPERAEEMASRYRDFVSRHCPPCFAHRLCSKCFAQVGRGRLDEETFLSSCEDQRRAVRRSLELYVTIKSERPDAFDNEKLVS